MSKTRFRAKIKIKKGDNVEVIAGKDKGRRGEILEVLTEQNKAIVAKINMVKKHNKPTAEASGGINEIPAPIHISNLMLVDPKTNEPTKVGRRLENGKLVRYSKKSDQTIK